jgi:hypothetical protein
MFLGHFGLALASKKINTNPSLGTTFLAAQFIDLLWPFFLLLNIEKVSIDPGNTAVTPLNFESYPYSHSLVAVLIWGFLFGIIYYLFTKNRSAALLLAALVVSHWFLDFVVHRPDLPLTFSEETKVGLGLWNSKLVTITIEMLLFFFGSYVYLRITEPKNKAGKYATWSLLIFLILIYVMNTVGDPPPDAKAIGLVGLAQWLLVAWAYWADANRSP